MIKYDDFNDAVREQSARVDAQAARLVRSGMSPIAAIDAARRIVSEEQQREAAKRVSTEDNR